MKVLPIKNEEAYPWILSKHYAKRLPSISFAFGLYEENLLKGIITYGMPASPSLCVGVCGEEYKHLVIELNRLCLLDNKKNQASYLIANSIKLLPNPKIIVSYADTGMNHTGYIYQATNFLFTGTTKERTDMASENGKHSRHSLGNPEIRVHRSSKHRYIYFHGTKKEKKLLREKLKYEVLDYLKTPTEKYDAGGSVATQELLFA
jgi:hypothetical protein